MSAVAVNIDVKHLNHQTMGDRELQIEILKLYRHQARLFLCRLETVSTAEELREMAHTLKGASLGIGAPEVAQSCKILEEQARSAMENSASIAHINQQPVIEAINAALDSIEELMISGF